MSDNTNTSAVEAGIPWAEAQALIDAAEAAAVWIAETRKGAKREQALDVIWHDETVAMNKQGVREMRDLRRGVRALRLRMGELASLQTKAPVEDGTDRAMVLEEAARKLEDMAAQREKERLALSNPIGALGSEIHARVTMLQTGASAIRALASKENR